MPPAGTMNRICQNTFNQFNEIIRTTSANQSVRSLCDTGKLEDALNVIISCPIQSDHSSYSNILQRCIDLRAEKQGRLFHNHLISNGFHSNLHFDTKLIIFYSNVGDMVSARDVFDKMPERSMVSWTALLSGYSRNGNSKNALMVFLEMHRKGVKANQFTYGSALRACTSLLSLGLGKQIQGNIQKSRFIENLFVQSALVDLHSKCGMMEDACCIFRTMTIKDLVCWNAMIGGFAVQGFSKDAYVMFRLMLSEDELSAICNKASCWMGTRITFMKLDDTFVESVSSSPWGVSFPGISPDSFTLGSLLKTAVGNNKLMKVMQLHGFIVKLGFATRTILIGSLIDAFVKCGSLKSAHNIYKSMLKKDTVSCTALITGYAHEGTNIRDAQDLFIELHRARMKIDNVILCSMLNICANTASLGLGRQIHAISNKSQQSQDIAMGNALIDMYSKSGKIEDAYRVFDEIEEKNVISWTSLIAGYGKHGNGHNAIELYKNMELEGFKPNDVTFLSLLFACSHNGLTAEGWEFFNRMVSNYNILPRVEHYACMVDLLARGGRLEEAYNLICKMNTKPNASLWGSILGACSTYGNMSLGEVAARHLIVMEPKNSANYVVLAGMYAAAGMWDNATKTRKMMEDRNLKKDFGCSFLQPTNTRLALPP